MSISNDALRKVLLEIEQKSAFSSQQIAIVKQQMAAKNREGRILQLTANEVGGLPRETRIYEGVGKMFVQTPPQEIVDRLGAESEELKSDMSSLEKKLHYLETTYKNSKDNLDQILKSAGGSS